MSRHYKLAFAIEKSHPYVTEGFSQKEAFEALRAASASKPLEVFALFESEGCLIFKDTRNNNTYVISLQED